MTYRTAVAGLALLMIGLGVVMIVVTAAAGGGVGLLLGALFVAAGAGRIYLMRKRT